MEITKPDWITSNGKVKETVFCADFLSRHPMRCINGIFYTVDGMLPDENLLRKTIFDEIEDYVPCKIAQQTEQIFKAMKLMAFSESPPLQCDRIHLSNGTYFLETDFSPQKEFCMNRLNVAYNPGAGPPERWLRFLEELLEPEDIPVLQEYLGYCLIPSTRGKKCS